MRTRRVSRPAGTRRGTTSRPAAAAARTRSPRRPSPARACGPASSAPSRSPATREHERRAVVVVDRDGIAGLDVQRRAHLVRARDSLDERLHRVDRACAACAPRRRGNVPAMSTVSGMTLFVVPARILVIETTTGSNVLMRRVASTWSACTISAATGIGSFARYGVDACPPLPVTVIVEHVGRRHERPALASRSFPTAGSATRAARTRRRRWRRRARPRRSCSARRGSLPRRVGT